MLQNHVKLSFRDASMFDSQLTLAFKPNQPHHHLYSTDKNHVIMGCNDTQAIDIGLTCEQEAIGKFVYDFYEKCDTDIFLVSNEEILRTGVRKTFVETSTYSDIGKSITYLSYKYPLKNAKGKIIGVMGMSVAIDHTPSDKFKLSPQQEKCFQLLLKGFNSEEIAEQMRLSRRTIEHYTGHIKVKLKCKSMRELILKYANK